MKSFLPTIILRHRKENLKKCSLRGLENREDLLFYRYPNDPLPPLSDYLLLSFEGPLLSPADHYKGIVLLDGTWRYAEKMRNNVFGLKNLPCRSLPKEITTAYPRKQEDCSNPTRGLASVEALFFAYILTGRNPKDLLYQYYWKETFLDKNKSLLGICETIN